MAQSAEDKEALELSVHELGEQAAAATANAELAHARLDGNEKDMERLTEHVCRPFSTPPAHGPSA